MITYKVIGYGLYAEHFDTLTVCDTEADARRIAHNAVELEANGDPSYSTICVLQCGTQSDPFFQCTLASFKVRP